MLASKRDLTSSIIIFSLPLSLSLLPTTHARKKPAFLHLMGLQGRWSSGPGDCVISLANLSPNVFPPQFAFLSHNDGSLRLEWALDCEPETTTPFPPPYRRWSAPPPAQLALSRTSALDVGHIWWRTLFFLIQNPPQTRLLYWFGRPRVERWRTSKQYSPMSVIWWRWRRANLLQRPGRVRKSSCPSPGKHI